MKNLPLTFLCILLYNTALFAQKHDYHWTFGSKSHPDAPTLGGSDLDFNTFPPTITKVDRQVPFLYTNISTCDRDGNLLFYSNGIVVAGKDGEVLENGEGLNPGWAADVFAEDGYNCTQGIISLPSPGADSVFHLFHIKVIPQSTDGLYHSIVDMTANGGMGKLAIKNQPLVLDTICRGQLTAVRHANGRDWWVLVPDNMSNRYYTLLLTPAGLDGPWEQAIGEPTGPYDNSGGSTFTPDGSKFIRYDIKNDLDIFDFDRCTGLLSNPLHIEINDAADTINGGGGVAVSPDSRVLYVPSTTVAYQFDLAATDISSTKTVVAVYDGFAFNLPTTFYMPSLAPDGKIYISCTNGVKVMHRIDRPNVLGTGCGFEQHSVEVPTRVRFGMPHFPNYRLGPLDGSACDTLGLDNHPLANFNFGPLDSSDLFTTLFTDLSSYEPATWYWDFGGTGSSQDTDPVHTFPGPGTYTVCLTVENQYDSDTVCKEVTIGTVGMDGVDRPISSFVVFPNPASSALTLVCDVPLTAPAVWSLRNTVGQEVMRTPLSAGQTKHQLSLPDVADGLYFWQVTADGRNVGSGKLIIAK